MRKLVIPFHNVGNIFVSIFTLVVLAGLRRHHVETSVAVQSRKLSKVEPGQ